MDISVYRRQPTEQEIAAAQSEISTHEQEVANLQVSIRYLQLQILQLSAKQAEHQRHISRHKGVLTLARRIPAEVLAKIFEDCVRSGWSRAPIVVAHVCSQWRAAAQSYPRVWSRIYADASNGEVIGRTKFWLKMARKAPLHITVVVPRAAHPYLLAEVINLLLGHADQWRTFTLETDIAVQARTISARLLEVDVNFPSLQHINLIVGECIDGDLDQMDDDSISIADTFSSERAPLLSSLRVACNILPMISYPSHIHHLDLSVKESTAFRPLSADSLLSLFETLPDLTSLTLSLPLEYDHPFVDDPDPLRYVELEQLETLILYGPTDLNRILFHIRAPSITNLHLRSLEDKGYRQAPIGPSLIHFLRSSMPSFFNSHPLKVLELHDIDLTPHFFNLCLTILDNLEELRLHESSISEDTLRMLNRRVGRPTYCPKLQRLVLRWCGHLPGHPLVDLVRSRNVVETSSSTGVETSLNIPGGFTDDFEEEVLPIEEVAVINCCFVEEKDVLDLAKMTTCRVIVRDTDYCYTNDCCGNLRYRQRLRFRHMMDLSAEQRYRLRLIL
ncbi:hypothetical protein C8Q75DRAFT_855774 [Abortiporus biennis]|nr:hypothetical protein C8Q75DRAFT_855774 [Abortiporus biennis]